VKKEVTTEIRMEENNLKNRIITAECSGVQKDLREVAFGFG